MPDWLRELMEGDVGALIANGMGIVVKHWVSANWHWRDMLIAVALGSVFVVWLAPGLAEYMDLGPKVYGSMCFLFGMFGLQLSRGFLRIAAIFSKNPEECLQRWRR